MVIKNKTIVTNKDWFNLAVFGDWHYGQVACNSDLIVKSCKHIAKQNPNEYGVILVGDLTENVVPGSKGSPFELDPGDPDAQVEWAQDKVDIIKNQVLGVVEGNHELRTRKKTGQFLCKNMIETVYGKKKANDYYFGLCGILNLQFKSKNGKKLQKYRIFITHGNGNATSVSGKLTKIHALRDRAEADIYVQGHLHQRLGMCDYMISNNVLRKRVYVCCSSYLIDASYAQEFGFRPTDYGMNVINLNTRESNIIGHF